MERNGEKNIKQKKNRTERGGTKNRAEHKTKNITEHRTIVVKRSVGVMFSRVRKETLY